MDREKNNRNKARDKICLLGFQTKSNSLNLNTTYTCTRKIRHTTLFFLFLHECLLQSLEARKCQVEKQLDFKSRWLTVCSQEYLQCTQTNTSTTSSGSKLVYKNSCFFNITLINIILISVISLDTAIYFSFSPHLQNSLMNSGRIMANYSSLFPLYIPPSSIPKSTSYYNFFLLTKSHWKNTYI